VDVTPPGRLVRPAAARRVKSLLEAKYKIFRETVEIQKRWRREVEESLGEEAEE